jgi:phosphoenolpyruvate-protein kinase (PTS system EI component)
MAAGRENPLVSKYFIEDHPAMIRLLRLIAQEAGDKPVGVCGEMAGHEAAIPILLGIGFRNLSVAPPLVPAVKQVIRNIATTD